MPLVFDDFFANTRQTFLARFHDHLKQAIQRRYENLPHGNEQVWEQALAAIPRVHGAEACFSTGTVRITFPDDEIPDRTGLRHQLRQFMPWRKGPWNIAGVHIDTEWRSDWKWKRLLPHITPLAGRNVLDIGTGNGYFLYRMLGAGANLAVGIDPGRVFNYQFQSVRKLLPDHPAFLLPLRCEDLPPFARFDTVFSLGVLYHRRSPVDHVRELISFSRPGGEIVLETLVVPGDDQTIVLPADRYASMRNVWFLPSPAALENLLRRSGLSNVRTVDINQTSVSEQRRTEWMDYQSLADFLDPDDPSLTIEGYPAPRRAIVIANAPP